VRFLGPDYEWDDDGAARVAVLPVAHEATTSYGKGTARGPEAMLAASAEIEHWDELRGRSPCNEFGIATLPVLRPSAADPAGAVDEIAEAAREVVASGRMPIVLGGEHSISSGTIRPVAEAAAAAGEELCAVVLDAHSDLRAEYDGTPFSHACAARRVSEHCPALAIGVRSLSEECIAFLDGEGAGRVEVIYSHEMVNAVPAAAIAGFCRGRSVFLSIDLDALDPSIMPATGTPEPGGLTWWQALGVIDEVARAASRIAYMDVVELAPIDGLAAPDFLAAKLAYKAITAAMLGPTG
jgi:agmatinase